MNCWLEIRPRSQREKTSRENRQRPEACRSALRMSTVRASRNLSPSESRPSQLTSDAPIGLPFGSANIRSLAREKSKSRSAKKCLGGIDGSLHRASKTSANCKCAANLRKTSTSTASTFCLWLNQPGSRGTLGASLCFARGWSGDIMWRNSWPMCRCADSPRHAKERFSPQLALGLVRDLGFSWLDLAT